MPRGEIAIKISSFFHILTSRRCQPSDYQVLSTFHYKQVRNSLATPSAAPLWVHLSSFHGLIISEFISVISVAERTDPIQNRSMKFIVGLPQPAYAFVSEVQQTVHGANLASLWPARQPISISTPPPKNNTPCLWPGPSNKLKYTSQRAAAWHFSSDYVTKSAVFTRPWMACQFVYYSGRRHRVKKCSPFVCFRFLGGRASDWLVAITCGQSSERRYHRSIVFLWDV